MRSTLRTFDGHLSLPPVPGGRFAAEFLLQ